MDYETYLKDYVFYIAPLYSDTQELDYSIFDEIKKRVSSSVLSSLLFYPVVPSKVVEVLYVSFVGDVSKKFFIYTDYSYLTTYNDYQDLVSPLRLHGREVVSYSMAAGRHYKNLIFKGRFLNRSLLVKKSSLLDGKKPVERTVYELPIGLDFLFFFSMTMDDLAVYMSLQLAQIEKYTFKKDITSLIKDVNSQFSLDMGMRYKVGGIFDECSVPIDTDPMINGEGLIKNKDPIYMSPFSGATHSFIADMPYDERLKFDYYNSNHSSNLLECLVGTSYCFRNSGCGSLDDYEAYQTRGLVFFNTVKRSGSIWNGVNLYYLLGNKETFCSCSKCEFDRPNFYARVQEYAVNMATELYFRKKNLYQDIYEIDGIYITADSYDELKSHIIWYNLMCPHFDGHKYGMNYRRDDQSRVAYKNIFNFEDGVTFGMRIEMAGKNEFKKKYMGKSSISKYTYEFFCRSPYYFELMKDFVYAYDYSAFVTSKEQVECGKTVTGVFVPIDYSSDFIPGINYKRQPFSLSISLLLSKRSYRLDLLSTFISVYNEIPGSRISRRKRNYSTTNDSSSLEDLVYKNIQHPFFSQCMHDVGFLQSEIYQFVNFFSGFTLVSSVVRLMAYSYVISVYMLCLSKYVASVLCVTLDNSIVSLLLSKDFKFKDDADRYKTSLFFGNEPKRLDAYYCVPSYTRLVKLMDGYNEY